MSDLTFQVRAAQTQISNACGSLSRLQKRKNCLRVSSLSIARSDV
jgi:hypothetical protein